MSNVRPRDTLLYDGRCPFCARQAGRLARWARGRAALVSFHDPGVLDRFPPLTYDECMKEIKLVEADGRISGGMEAVARTARLNPWLAPFSRLYDLPLIRQISDYAYRWTARNRYRMSRPHDCPDGTCDRHLS